MIDPERTRGNRSSPQWLDRPQGTAFWVTVDRLKPAEERDPWPSWLAPTPPQTLRDSARSGAIATSGARRARRAAPHDAPRPPSEFPAPAGA